MDIKIDVANIKEVDCVKLHKMAFIYNAVQSGWCVRLNKNAYVFTKKHEGKKEIYLDNYLKNFVESNMDADLLK